MKYKKRIKRKYRLKKPVKRIIQILLSITVISIAIGLFSHKLSNKKETPINKKEITYEKTTRVYVDNPQFVDCLFIGNSDLYTGMLPLQMWNEQGITSYVCAKPKQTIRETYKILEEVMLIQKPKVVFLELDVLYENRIYAEDDVTENILRYCYPLIEGRSKWRDITREVLEKRGYVYDNKMKNKGSVIYTSFESNSEGFSYMNKERSVVPISTNMNYLKKIIDITTDNNIELCFIWYPSSTTGSNGRSRYVNKIANQYDIPLLDFNVNLHGVPFDWTKDTKDKGNHLNYYGAKKFTTFLGEYIKKNYKLKDHRNDEKYSQWDQDYSDFKKRYQNKITVKMD